MASFETEVLQRLTAIETKLEGDHYKPGECAVHNEKIKVANHRIDALEVQQGKQNLVAMSVGAVSAGIVLAIKYLVTKTGG